jgi:predicted MFS family arabinose efflux permease
MKKQRKIRIPNPLHTLAVVLEKDVGLLLLFNAIIYCSFYDVMASAPDLLEQIYGFDALQIGLCFLPMGCGAFLATGVSGVLMGESEPTCLLFYCLTTQPSAGDADLFQIGTSAAPRNG